MSTFERIVLYVSLILVIVVGVYVLNQEPAGELDTRVSALEGRFQDADGNDIDLKQYVKWADAVTEWTEDTDEFTLQVFEFFKDGKIVCSPDCPIEGTGPPGGGTCKPGTC